MSGAAIRSQRSSSGTGASAAYASSSNTSPRISAAEYARQAAKLSHLPQDAEGSNGGAAAVRAEWITPQDPIIVTADGGRLPEVPLEEAHKLNRLKEEVDRGFEDALHEDIDEKSEEKGSGVSGLNSPSARINDSSSPQLKGSIQKSGEGSLRNSMPPFRTNPLFPPLPLYGPPSFLRNVQCVGFRCTSAVLSLAFLGGIVIGSAIASLPLMLNHIWLRLNFQNPDERRPFYEEEKRRGIIRREKEVEWAKKQAKKDSETMICDLEEDAGENDGFIPTEGGPDPLVCDVGYYARRVGLDVETFKVETEDGFIIDLWHVYDPRGFTPLSKAERDTRGPNLFTGAGPNRPLPEKGKRKFPVLMMHGLLQSAGAYCTNDDDSLAFFLCKSGYDVWLGNNRCGFKPEHTLLEYSDPRMWAWNIRQMGVMDLPALVSRVLSETGFAKLGLVCHSQGTTQTFVALAKEQRPDLGDKITVFCALAPAAYAGPLIGKKYFKFMRAISPAFFRVMFGIHAFIPLMMTMHAVLPGTLYGAMGYRVFSFLFNWTDDRWDRGLRDRMFQFAPVYVSAESMRWWLGRECFAKQKCILQTREEWRQEDAEDEMEECGAEAERENRGESGVADVRGEVAAAAAAHRKKPRGATAWYDARVPPFALWVAGSDDLVDGRRLLRRFASGREPHVRVVHERVVEGYEHLDVIWAMDSIEKVGREVREVIWKTCNVRDECMVPKGCEGVRDWVPGEKLAAADSSQSSSSVEGRGLRGHGLRGGIF